MIFQSNFISYIIMHFRYKLHKRTLLIIYTRNKKSGQTGTEVPV
jgi:hypothetical protein